MYPEQQSDDFFFDQYLRRTIRQEIQKYMDDNLASGRITASGMVDSVVDSTTVNVFINGEADSIECSKSSDLTLSNGDGVVIMYLNSSVINRYVILKK